MAKEKENLKGMKKDELKKKLTDMQEALRVLRFKAMGSRSKNVKEEAGMKKDIARIQTELTAKK